ncbi:Shedu anti-phage system protein SduA domain-containing protein [Chryseobacterium balustinum]|uniref:Shedu anti-phage system protein SduA domain-containing protein n=1 Tax=Chryseobacterium balustinum TaxID=246 RepID=UPI003CEFF37F
MYKISELNEEQKEIFKKFENFNNQVIIENVDEGLKIVLENPFVLNTDSLFPNHYLNEYNLLFRLAENLKKLEEFKILIDSKENTERQVLNFIHHDQAFLIAAIMEYYTTFGHHEAYFFKEFQLSTEFKADFLIIGKNSDGYHFLFVELENIYNKITIDDGKFGETIRKGINQIEDWKFWIEKNFQSLRSLFMKYKNPNKNLPSEFYEFDSSRFNYSVIAGRRNDFSEITYRKARELRKNNIILSHYDKLVEGGELILRRGTY